jgi:hypothetical protein
MSWRDAFGIRALVTVALVAGVAAPSAPGQEPSPTAEPQAQPAEPSPPRPPKPGPKYLALRYDEDFSYLDGPPGSYEPDLFDPIKWIHLTDDLTLTLGGSARARVEAETNRAMGVYGPGQDTYLLHRYRLHADLRYRQLMRVYAEFMSAHVEDRDLGLRSNMENHYDIYQLFIDVRPLGEDVPLTLRVGRQELQYGYRRLISAPPWGNVGQKFDGVKLMYEHELWNVDLFYVHRVPVELSEGLNRKPDRYREEEHFYGLYSTYKGIPRHVVDAYFLALHDTDDRTNANGRSGDQSVYTVGSRLGGKTGGFDYEAEVAGQWGSWAGDDVRAWMAGLDTGYTLQQVAWQPRLGAGFDYGSGDANPTDGVHQTFTRLFPTAHAFFGDLDLFSRQNIVATNLNLTVRPHEDLRVRLTWFTFWLDETRDALYDSTGRPTRRDTTGSSGHDLGNELDVAVNWKLDTHQSLLFGYAHFWDLNYIQSTGLSEDADLLYLQYQFQF